MKTYTITLTEPRRSDYELALLKAASVFEEKGDSANCRHFRGLAQEISKARLVADGESVRDPMKAIGKRYQRAAQGVVFLCTAYRDREGYLMVPEVNICPETWVSESAIDRTFIETWI